MRYKLELEEEVKRLKEFELSKLRIEEGNKYRQKLAEMREELEREKLDKVREVKARELEAWDRIKNRERELDKQAFEIRQRQMRDEEVMRARENEVRKIKEVEQLQLRQEKDMVDKLGKDLELKLKDLEKKRVQMEKEQIEDIERFKSELQRQMQD